MLSRAAIIIPRAFIRMVVQQVTMERSSVLTDVHTSNSIKKAEILHDGDSLLVQR